MLDIVDVFDLFGGGGDCAAIDTLAAVWGSGEFN